jgi:hypothetical protein
VAGSEDLFKWFTDTYNWDTMLIHFVDWEAHHAAMGKVSFAEKQFITKFNFQWLPTGHQQHKIDSAQSTLCPSCCTPAVEETETNLYQCPQRLPLVGNLFNRLQKFHEEEHTCPSLQDTLFTALQNDMIFGRHPSFSNHHENEEVTRFRQNRPFLAGTSSFGDDFRANGQQSKTFSSSLSWSIDVTLKGLFGSANLSIFCGSLIGLSGMLATWIDMGIPYYKTKPSDTTASNPPSMPCTI